jgi:hypothetical protein
MKPGRVSRINLPGGVTRADEDDDVDLWKKIIPKEDVRVAEGGCARRCAGGSQPMTPLHPKSRKASRHHDDTGPDLIDLIVDPLMTRA